MPGLLPLPTVQPDSTQDDEDPVTLIDRDRPIELAIATLNMVFRVAILTVSDTAFNKGAEYDLSGPLLVQNVEQNADYALADSAIVPDEVDAIQAKVKDWASRKGIDKVDWVITSGGASFESFARSLSDSSGTPQELDLASGMLHLRFVSCKPPQGHSIDHFKSFPMSTGSVFPHLSTSRSLTIPNNVLLIKNSSSGLVTHRSRFVRPHVGSLFAREQESMSGGMGGNDGRSESLNPEWLKSI